MRKILSILLALSLALSLSVPALAASGGVTYLAYNAETGEFETETKAEGEYTVVTGETDWGTAGQETWYVESADVEISTRITVSGDVHLILVDNCTLKAEKGITVNSGNSLTIYGQTAGTGTLTTGTPDTYYAGIGGYGTGTSNPGNSGAITINGGTVSATGGKYGAGIGGGYKGTGAVTIHGGTVTGTGGEYGAGIGGGDGDTGDVTINGGTVTAEGGSYAAGIGSGCDVSNSTVTISGGFVAATGGNYGAAIGSGGSGSAGAEADESSFTNAVVLKKSGASGSTMTGQVYGSPTLTADATVPSGITLAIPENASLSIDGDMTLTNNGAITNSGTVINDGTVIGNPITGNGTFIIGGNIIIDENSKNQGGAASLAHEVAPAYTVTIPASVTIGNKATVKAEGVRVDYGKQVVVRLSGDSALTVALEGDASETLAYTVKDANGNGIDKGGAVLAVNPANATGNALASGSAELAFSLAESAVVKYSGSYTGTVTFTVSVEQADSTGGTD